MVSLNVNKTQYKVSDFLSWQRANTLVLSPSFQRRSVWNTGTKSYLIDTIVNGLPIPIIFLREQKSDLGSLEPKREVVDGQQRLRTLISYIEPSLLSDHNPERDDFQVRSIHNPGLANRTFSQLPEDLRQRILDYQFSVHVLPSGVDDRAVLGIFARMNSTGVKLNPQELRNAQFFGAFKTSMYSTALSHLPRWRAWKIFREEDIARMNEVELTSEFALLALSGLTAKSGKSLDQLYRRQDEHFPEREEIEGRLNTIMATIEDKLASLNEFRTFRRKALFYGLFAFLYECQFGIGSQLKPMKPRTVPSSVIPGIKSAENDIRNKTAPEDVLKSITRRNTNLYERETVLKYLQEKAGNG